MSIKSWVRGAAIATLVGTNSLLMLTPALAKDRSVQPNNPYNPADVQEFVGGCEAEARNEPPPEGIDPQTFQAFMVEICACLIWEMQNQYTHEQFEALGAALERNEKWAETAMDTMIESCIFDPG
ncbi:MAG: hypothetical protein F6J87_05250 [Spirulina sp. SIO3F2]|nr:hypothetical protein [Spirulina sp. SIO3F2]